jgi:hypothetical protein
MAITKSRRRRVAKQKPAPLALRLSEASEVSGFSPTTLWRLRRQGRIICRKAGRTVLVDYQSLKDAIDDMPAA